jgi:hypothetical protein
MEVNMDRIVYDNHAELSELELHDKDVCRINHYVPRTQIICKKGILWLTQTGDGKDHILSAGERFSSGHRGLVLLGALPEARVSIVPPSRN